MSALNDTSKMPYGKHKGDTLREVPAQYLLWLRQEFIDKGSTGTGPFGEFNKELKAYIEDNLDALNSEMGRRTGRR
jgi:uncharacterized protein (DUF3820 family)